MGKHRATLLGEKNPRYTHGGARTKLYDVWAGMRNRCNPKSAKIRKYWAARGIKVCDEWLDFSVFKTWAVAAGYRQGLQIDRRDWRGNYCPENCRWATVEEQAKNRSSTIATDRVAERIVFLSNAGLQINEIARAIGCSQRPVCRIRALARVRAGKWAMSQLVSKNKAGGWDVEIVLP